VHEQPARELAVLLQLVLLQLESLQWVSVALAQLVLLQQESLQPVLTLESVEFQP
jgi:hypothetical protein